MFVAVCDPATGRMTWCNAGHPPALLRRADGTLQELEPTGRILGVLPDPTHVEGEEVHLQSGDMLLLYTDGLPEAMSPGKELFGMERVKTLLAGLQERPPQEILKQLLRAVTEFSESEHFEDDLTLVVVRGT